MKNILLVFLLSISIFGCSQSNRKPNTDRNVKVHSYHALKDDGDEWLWYYLIYTNNTTYYYISPTPMTTFSNVEWRSGSVNMEEFREVVESVQDIDLDELPNTIQDQAIEVEDLDNNSGIDQNEIDNPDNNYDSDNDAIESSSDDGGFDAGSDYSGDF